MGCSLDEKGCGLQAVRLGAGETVKWFPAVWGFQRTHNETTCPKPPFPHRVSSFLFDPGGRTQISCPLRLWELRTAPGAPLPQDPPLPTSGLGGAGLPPIGPPGGGAWAGHAPQPQPPRLRRFGPGDLSLVGVGGRDRFPTPPRPLPPQTQCSPAPSREEIGREGEPVPGDGAEARPAPPPSPSPRAWIRT